MLCKNLDQFCKAYLDNMVAYSNLLVKYREHVQLILAKLWEAGLYLKFSKCEFEMQQISFVRFIVVPKDVVVEPDRVCMIAEQPEPTCHHDIQVFLSFANLYRRFITSFSHLAKLITDLLKGGGKWPFFGPLSTYSSNEIVLCGATQCLHQGPCAGSFRSCQANSSRD